MSKKKDTITLELLRVYESFAEQLNISADISKVLHGISDIKASGNEIEEAFRNTLRELLPRKYAIGHGHIIDRTLTVSRQYDLIISEAIEFTSILKTKDTTELFFYETVYAIAEVKATWTLANLQSTRRSIYDIRTRLNRREISNKTILSGSSEIQLNTAVSLNPARNPLFTFAFAVRDDGESHKMAQAFKDPNEWRFLPNMIVILNKGVYVLTDKSKLSKGKLAIVLYPEFAIDTDKYEWKFISCSAGARSLAYLMFCLLEHLSVTILEKPSYLEYSSSILNINDEDLLNIDEL